MKILEAQSAMLTNYDVYKHLSAQETKHNLLYNKEATDRGPNYSKQISQRPANLRTVRKELLEYFEEAPSPLSTNNNTQPITYTNATVTILLQKLRKFNLTKAEIIMIMNLRPKAPEILNTVVEEFESRFEEDEQQEMVDLIAEALGRADGDAERKAMVDSAHEAREREQEVYEKRLKEEVEDDD